MKTIIIVNLILFVLVGCSSNEDNIKINIQNDNQVNSELNINPEWNIKIESNWLTKWSTIKFEERKVEVDMKNNELTIEWKTLIKEWKAEDFSKDFPIIKWWNIYQNSNMQKYAFIIVENNSIEKISDYYKTNLQLNWYNLVVNNNEEIIDIEADENEDFIKTTDFLKFTKNISEEQVEEIILNINTDIPKILKENFNFEWIFVEITFNDLFVEPIIEEENLN